MASKARLRSLAAQEHTIFASQGLVVVAVWLSSLGGVTSACNTPNPANSNETLAASTGSSDATLPGATAPLSASTLQPTETPNASTTNCGSKSPAQTSAMPFASGEAGGNAGTPEGGEPASQASSPAAELDPSTPQGEPVTLGRSDAGPHGAGGSLDTGTTSSEPSTTEPTSALDAGTRDALDSAGPPEGTYTGPTEPVPDLRFYGLLTAVELAPLRLAVDEYYPNISINSGGVDALCNNQADIASNAETQLLRSSVENPGCEQRIIFTICEGLYRMVARKSQVASLADLVGKQIAVSDSTSADYFVFKLFRDAGLGTNYQAMGSPNGGTFNNANIWAAAEWEPNIDAAAQALGDDVIEFQKDDTGNYVYRELFNLHATVSTLNDPDKRRGIVELVRALIQTSWEIRQDPSAAWSVMRQPTGIGSEDAYLRSMKYVRFDGTLVDDVLDVLDTEESTWHAPVRATPRQARSRDQLAELIDTSILAEALSR